MVDYRDSFGIDGSVLVSADEITLAELDVSTRDVYTMLYHIDFVTSPRYVECIQNKEDCDALLA